MCCFCASQTCGTRQGKSRTLWVVHTNTEEDREAVGDSFNKFLSGLQGIMSTNREQEELSIMNQR